MAKLTISGATGTPVKIDDPTKAIQGFICPNCKGKFDLPLNAFIVTCPHCGVPIVYDPDGTKIKQTR